MAVDTFRRFTYFITSDDDNFLEILTSETFKQLQSLEGVEAFNIYKKDGDYFVVIDTDASFNSEQLFDAFSHLEDFKNIFVQHSAPLDRIYELDQKVVYKPTEGQLKTAVAPYKRFVWTLLLEPDLIDEYKSVHAMGMAWPEITANMKSVGVKDMEIYIHKEQVMLIMDTMPDFNLDEVGPKWQKLPREEEWQAYVAKFQKTDTESSIQEKWQDMIKL
ncbi:L-rhamnose mutarotase [Maribacter vaceletii]|uniref:L-rhamnose mutarotase n=1 Tax=Maribacter vaceletii TaxID=1206816 RepID=A0A495E8I0_9FLAO|nr:L-rhamnose mutarotase [Maribacter vaceletii]RKR13228.1 L-rhamnose mutarotase [Maribacter vaceletii]